MKVIVVSGFLGSGKTTFIETFSKRLDNLAILENDYARANIDQKILSSSSSDIYSLEDGCICCSMEADFATTLITISNDIKPDYLIIEPTGLGFLSQLMNNIQPIAYDKVEILSPISLVDYHGIEDNIKEYGDLFIDQIKNAGHILLSKIENLSQREIDLAVKRLREYTDAHIHSTHYSKFEDEDWNMLLSEFDYDTLDLSDLNNLELDNLVFEDVVFDDFHSLGSTLNAISANRFGKVLRGKGVVKVDDKDVKVDIVKGQFNVEKYLGPILNKFVLIGEDLEERAFKVLFNKL